MTDTNLNIVVNGIEQPAPCKKIKLSEHKSFKEIKDLIKKAQEKEE